MSVELDAFCLQRVDGQFFRLKQERGIGGELDYLAIGLVLVVSGIGMTRKRRDDEERVPAFGPERVALEVVIGLGLGVLAALTGLMMGSLRLPMMIRYLRIDAHVAVGSNMAIGFLTAAAGALTALALNHWSGGPEYLTVLVVVIPPTALGGYLGGWATGLMPKDKVTVLAGWIIAVTGLLMVGQATASVASRAPIPPLTGGGEPG